MLRATLQGNVVSLRLWNSVGCIFNYLAIFCIHTLKCFPICTNPHALRGRLRTEGTPGFCGPRKMTSNFQKRIWQASMIVHKWTLPSLIFSYFFGVVTEVGLGPQAKVRCERFTAGNQSFWGFLSAHGKLVATLSLCPLSLIGDRRSEAERVFSELPIFSYRSN